MVARNPRIYKGTHLEMDLLIKENKQKPHQRRGENIAKDFKLIRRMSFLVSQSVPWHPFVAPNPNIPFEVYLNLISPVWRPPLPYPLRSNGIMYPSPYAFHPTDDDARLKPTSIRRSFASSSGGVNLPKVGVKVHLKALEPKYPKCEKNTNLKKYKCKQCGRCFSRSNTLVTHERIHTGEKPFKCGQCNRQFRQYGNLARHKIIHTNLKPFTCHLCTRAFNRKSNLKTHMRIHCTLK